MAVVSKFYCFTDLRQSLVQVDLKTFFPKVNLNFREENDYVANVWLQPVPLESWFLSVNTQFCKINTTTLFFDTNVVLTSDSPVAYYWSSIFQKLNWGCSIFPLDASCWLKNKKTYIFVVFSCFFKKNMWSYFYALDTKVLQSLSKSFSSFVWVEREIKEFYNVSFLGLKDGRRLLTDYTVITPEYNSYETRGYNNIIQDLYFKGLLHWLFIFSYLTFCLLISFCFLNRGLLSLLLVSEAILLMIFIIAITIASLFNLYYMLIFSFFILVFGGLELSLNLLILLM